MVIEVKPREEDIDAKVLRLFLKCIEILGGPRKLVEYRNLTWLPSLMAASYAIIYARDKHYSADRIGEILGISTTTVKNILSADETIAREKIESILKHAERDEEKKTHMAGALAKMAYKEILNGRDEISIMMHLAEQTSRSLGVEWAVKVLSMLRGTDFPITSKEVLLSKLKGISIKGKSIEDIAQSISYPVYTPAELLHKIKVCIES